MRLAGRVAVITGATRGLGSVLARAFIAEGCRVMCASRNEAGVQALLEEHPDAADFRQTDVTDATSVEALMRAAEERFGRLDVLVSNAGVSRPGPLAQLPVEHWQETVGTNLTGTYLCTRAAVPYLERSPYPRIINMSSALATRVAVGASAYAASKAGVEMLTRVSAIELAPRGITVNCLSPGIIDEGMGRQLAANEAVWKRFEPKLALGRPGTGAEVAHAAVFLAGDEAAYVNGHVLEVNGGLDW